MPLILPNTITNEIPADGDKLGQNFLVLQDWANQDAVTADGSTAMAAPLLLPGAPTQPNQAATKGYVDSYVPVGVMWEYAGDAPPANWMLCRGQALSRATYAALFTAIGTRFGAGDNVATFNLPNMQGRYAVGYNPDQVDGSYFSVGIGERAGDRDAMLPLHSHDLEQHTHQVNVNSGTESAFHDHDMAGVEGPAGGAVGAFGLNRVGAWGGGGYNVFGRTSGNVQLHTHPVNGDTGGSTAFSAIANGTDPTNGNLPPSVSFNFIIKVA